MSMTGAITFARGFKAAGVRAGIKQSGEDLAVICSDVPASCAGVFTTNVVKAAPVILSKARLPRAGGRAILVNSGNANACTGVQGAADAERSSAKLASLLGIDSEDVFIASTGIIGHAMPMDRIETGIESAVKSLSVDGASAARAIMTTDTYAKEAAVSVQIGESEVRIGGIAKGAGMIDPNVATMLSFITTDAAITPDMLQLALSRSADVSYNCLTVDGDTSTNDTVIILANGIAGNGVIDSEGAAFDIFQKALDDVTTTLAKLIAADGEGATKLVHIIVEGGESYRACKQIAKTIANSPLVKTALFGCDPNWGRVLAAAGRAGIEFSPQDAYLYFGNEALVEAGEPVGFPAEDVHDYLTGKEVVVRLKIGSGPASARVWTCDFSYDYVKINAEYHT
jgi:glutamate N-acetyltransferase/amino-acid N-acetyltransferase